MQTASEILFLCRKHLSEYDLVNVTTALNRIAKSRDRRSVTSDPTLANLEAKLLAAFLNSSIQKTPQSIANSARAVAKLGKGRR